MRRRVPATRFETDSRDCAPARIEAPAPRLDRHCDLTHIPFA